MASTTITPAVPSGQSSVSGVFECAWKGLIELRGRQIAQRQYQQLLDSDEAVLADIGVTRAEVLRAVRGQM
jgi:uncharacterized protein YjiS (DUF1127 family)